MTIYFDNLGYIRIGKMCILMINYFDQLNFKPIFNEEILKKSYKLLSTCRFQQFGLRTCHETNGTCNCDQTCFPWKLG